MCPLDKFDEAINIIKGSIPSPECKPIYNYFKRNWIEKESFPPVLWNHFDHSEWRTTNFAEGFHSKFNKLINKSHPSVYVLIEFIKTIETASTIQLHRVQNAPLAHNSQIVTTKRRKCDIEKDETIEIIKQEYSQGLCTFKEFYSKMCIHLSSLLYVYDEFDVDSSNDSENDNSISEVENEQDFIENALVEVQTINVRTEQPILQQLEFTEDQIREEIYNIWRLKGITRKRISKLDREEARRNLQLRRGDTSESTDSD